MSGKTTSVVNLLKTLPDLLKIILGGYSLSLDLGQVQFSSVVVHPFIATSFSSSNWLPSLSSRKLLFLATYGTCGDDTAQGGMLEYLTGAHLVSHIS